MTTIVNMGRVAALLLLLLALPLAAQTGGVAGTVRDSSGGVLANATVTITNRDNNARQTQTTGDTGNFAFPQISPGSYRLEVKAPGFKTFVQPDFSIDVQQQAAIDPVMQIGDASESIQVIGDTPLLQPNTSSLGQVISNQQISELPLSGRNSLGLSVSPRVLNRWANSGEYRRVPTPTTRASFLRAAARW